MKKQTQEQFLETIDRLLEKLAEREAEIVKLRAAADTHCKAMEDHGYTNLALRKALSTPPSTSYLEQWEKDHYGEPVAWLDLSKITPSGIVYASGFKVNAKQSPLYARKEK